MQDLLLLLEATVGSASSSFARRGQTKSFQGAEWFLSWVFAFPTDCRVPWPAAGTEWVTAEFPPV